MIPKIEKIPCGFSRKYCIFAHNGDSIWGLNEEFLGPEKTELVGQAFFGFWLECCSGNGRYGYILFACPTTLDILPPDNVVLDFWTTGDIVPKIDKERVLKYLYPELDDPMEYILRIELKRNYKK